MRLAISAPSGYNAREILLPLREVLDADTEVTDVAVICPAAKFAAELFPQFSDAYTWHENPSDLDGHKHLFERLQPDVVLTPTIGLDTNDIAILRAANQLGIRTVTFVASWDNVFKMERLKAKGHGGDSRAYDGDYELPHAWAVWNKMNYEHILKVFPDVDPTSITITGPPRFDYFAHIERIPARSELYDFLGVTDPTASLIHGATTELYSFEYIVEALAQAREKQSLAKPVALYTSVHPGGDKDRHPYEKYGAIVKYSFGRRENARHPNFAYVPTDEETYMLISLFTHTDVLVNQSSTVAIESFAVDKPVINVAYGQPWDWWNWYRSMVYRDFKQHYRYITDEGATRIVKNKHALVAQVNAYFEDPNRDSAQRHTTITKMITYTDGTCSKRLLEVVKNQT